MSRDRGENGRFVQKASVDDVLAVLEARMDPLTGTEVGDELGISNRAALDKLNELHDRGTIERKKVGGRSVVWWLPSERAAHLDDGTGIETAADRVGGFGLFADEDGEAFADAVTEAREEFAADYEERHDDLFGQ
jgi:predicted ArsR family transcriptional regulator